MRKALARKAFVLIVLSILFLAVGYAGRAGNTPEGESQQAAYHDSPCILAFKSLTTMNKTYNPNMTSLGDLYRKKLINEQVKTKVIEYGTASKLGWIKGNNCRALDTAMNPISSTFSLMAMKGYRAGIRNKTCFFQ
jgi:hypothetical protein